MHFSIYQIQTEYDKHHQMYKSFDDICANPEKPGFPLDIYEIAYEGTTELQNLDDIYTRFNTSPPEDFHGRSLSVSDVVLIDEPIGIHPPGAYYCEPVGWKEITSSFKPYLTQPKKVSCLYFMPNMEAQTIRISPSLKHLQDACLGNIECVHVFEEDDLILICNEEGKIQNLPLSRAIFDGKKMLDVIAGPFLLMQEDDRGEFQDLDPVLRDKYLTLYGQPERIYLKDGEIHVDKKLAQEIKRTM